MPAAFDKWVKSKGSRVRTKDLPSGKYIHIWYYPNGRSVAGEAKAKKAK